MALYADNMLEIAMELAMTDEDYADMVLKFLEHDTWITSSLVHLGGGTGMWDEEDGFFYDVLRLPDGQAQRLKVRSMVGLLPLCAATVFEPELFAKYPEIAERFQWFLNARPELCAAFHDPRKVGVAGRRLFSVLDEGKLRRVLAKLLDENEFLSPYGIRSLSRYHADHPYVLHAGGQEYRVGYLPAESDTGMFGGNSNWRGPIWMPVNSLIIRALANYYAYYGDDFTVECPTGSGRHMNLYQVAEEITRRLASIFLRDNRRPAPGLRRVAEVPGGPALAGSRAVLRVLPRRQWGGPGGQPPDRMDGDHRPGHAHVCHQHGGTGARTRPKSRHCRDGIAVVRSIGRGSNGAAQVTKRSGHAQVYHGHRRFS